MIGLISLRCGDVADAVFGHNNDRNKRDRLALALVALSEAIVAQGIEAATADETGTGSAVGESPVGNADAPETQDLSTPLPSGSIER